MGALWFFGEGAGGPTRRAALSRRREVSPRSVERRPTGTDPRAGVLSSCVHPAHRTREHGGEKKRKKKKTDRAVFCVVSADYTKNNLIRPHENSLTRLV